MLIWLLLTLIWLQTPRAGLAQTRWAAACITALTNLVFLTNRILPIQYQEQIALVVILRDSKLTYFLSSDGWFLGVYLSKEKVLLKKIIIQTWGLKHPRKSRRYFLITRAKYSQCRLKSCRHLWCFTCKSNDTVKATNTQVCWRELAVQQSQNDLCVLL